MAEKMDFTSASDIGPQTFATDIEVCNIPTSDTILNYAAVTKYKAGRMSRFQRVSGVLQSYHQGEYDNITTKHKHSPS